MLYINKVYISSYHPQLEGFIERVNEIILQSLAMYVSSRQADCDVFLTAVVYRYNGNTPFFLTYRREPVFILDTNMLPPMNLSPNIDFHRQQMRSQIYLARDMAKEQSQKALTIMKQYYDQHSKELFFQVGHQVWIYSPAVKTGLTKKLARLWHVLFKLVEQVLG